MSSERYEGLEQDLQNLIENAKLIYLNRLSTSGGEEKKAVGRDLNRMIDKGQIMVQDMENELRNAPGGFRIQMNSRLNGYKRQLDTLAGDVRRATAGGGYENMAYGASGSFAERESQNRSRLLEGHASLQRASDSIARSHVIAAETDDIGVGVISELGGQREQLERTRDRLVDTQGDLGRSRKILNQMGTRIITNKILLIVIIIVELGILGGLVYWKFFSK